MRSRVTTSFHLVPFGRVITPANAVRNAAEAQAFADYLHNMIAPLPPYSVVETAVHTPLRLIPTGSTTMLFVPAETELALPAHELPGMVDANLIVPKDRDLIEQIEIIDPEVRGFVRRLLNNPAPPSHVEYLLVHHNYRLPGSTQIRLRADTLVLVYKDRGTTYILTRGLRRGKRSFPVQLLNLEALIDDYPDRLVLRPDRIQVSPKIYSELYRHASIETAELPHENILPYWPFPLPARPFIELTTCKSNLRQTWQDYRLALKDRVFGPGALGCVLQSSGYGLMEGALLIPILQMAENPLGVIAAATFLLKLTLSAYLYGNKKAGAIIKAEEGQLAIGQSLDKKIPLWDIGQRYIMNTRLIRQDAKATALAALSAVFYLHLFPPIFNFCWSTTNLVIQSSIFMVVYLAADILKTYADAFSQSIFFKLCETRIRHNETSPELRKSFWDIQPFHENLETAANQISLLAGVGLFSLFSATLPAYFPAVGIGLGVLGVVLCAARFLLPLFGREESSLLIIKRSANLRIERMLAFSDNVHLNIGDNVKVKKVDEPEKDRTLILDFLTSGVKLRFAKPVAIEIKTSRLGRFLRFARQQKITIRVIDAGPQDPEVALYNYGREQYNEAQIRERFIEVAG